jgi:hypothetical protein
MNPIDSLIEFGQSHHYYHHFSTLMVLDMGTKEEVKPNFRTPPR